MESVIESLLTNPTVIAAIFLGASVLILVYISKLFRKEEIVERKVKHEKSSHPEKKKDPAHSGKSKKKVAENRWTGRNEKQAYSHPWLLTSLKGHTGTILDMNFSSNGKYLTSCGDEDPDPGGLTTESSSSSSSSECNKENSRPPSVEPSPRVKGLSRRQRKNRRRDDSSPEIQKQKKQRAKKATTAPKTLLAKKKTMAYDPNSHYFNYMSERTFVNLLDDYILSNEEMTILGYPMESSEGGVTFHSSPYHRKPVHSGTKFDVNAREFVPKQNGWNNNDSGHGSGSSSDSGENCDSEESSSGSDPESPVYFEQAPRRVAPPPVNPEEVKCFKRTCVRCGQFFFTTDKEYLTLDECYYHWGRLRRVHDSDEEYNDELQYTCCRAKEGSRGCSTGKVHVWNGVVNGPNGPYDDYVRTERMKVAPREGHFGAFALDCEMCYTVHGLEVAKVSVVGITGLLAYETFVKPDSEIVDYNTRFSGITAKDLTAKKTGRPTVKTLREVQEDLLRFISADTILIGHGLENDLRVLRIIHGLVVDTAVVFPHFKGLPYKRALKALASSYLGKLIQWDTVNGHDSYEDASTCMELMLWRALRDHLARH